MNTPILLLLFNRPDLVAVLIERLSKVRPKHLYIACDGPRNGWDRQKIEEIKNIINDLTWEVEVKTLFRDTNLQTYKAVPNAIDWFFTNVSEGIILEDDCLPDISFFSFCEENLGKYRDDTRVLTISGNNIQEKAWGNASYYFSHVPHIWGWATWKRAWELFDFEMKEFPEFKKKQILSQFFIDKRVEKRIMHIFQKAYNGASVWDFKLTYLHFQRGEYSIIPNSNLVTNVGFDSRATHPLEADSFLANLPIIPINNIIHANKIELYVGSYTRFGTINFRPYTIKTLFIKTLLYCRKWMFQKLDWIKSKIVWYFVW